MIIARISAPQVHAPFALGLESQARDSDLNEEGTCGLDIRLHLDKLYDLHTNNSR